MPRTPHGPLLARAAASLGVPSAVAREVARRWLALVDPGTTGPDTPTEGFEIEAAVHSEQPAPEGPGLLVRFQIVSLRFHDDAWVPIDGRHVGKPRIETPTTLPAALPMESIAEAWADFQAEVDAFNRTVWAEEGARLWSADRTAAEAREAQLREQGTSDLLP